MCGRSVTHERITIEKRTLPLTALVRWKFILAKVLAQKINRYRETASKDRYQQTLFGQDAAVETTFQFEFGFTPTGYAPHWTYIGHPYQFERHFYASVGELGNKGEEYECAKALDRCPRSNIGFATLIVGDFGSP
jgi:type III restriction enzyme